MGLGVRGGASKERAEVGRGDGDSGISSGDTAGAAAEEVVTE